MATVLVRFFAFLILMSLSYSSELVTQLEDIRNKIFNIDYNVNALQNQRLSGAFFKFVPQFIQHRNGSDSGVWNDDQRCTTQLLAIVEGIARGNIWALEFVDAWGALPAGMFYGNFHDFGNYEECMRLNAVLSNNTQSIKGKYCWANLPIGQSLHIDTLSVFGDVKMATCIPDTCNATNLDIVLKDFMRNVLHIQINASTTILREESCVVQQTEPLSGVAITAIAILTLLVVLVTLCTLCDYASGTLGRVLHPLFKAFSLRSNAHQLLQTCNYSENPNVIPCLNGIRCLSLIWVIFSHDFTMLLASPNLNIFDILDWLQTPFSMFLTQGFFSVDSFFFLSSFLVALLVLRELDKNSGKLNLPLMYLHRYLRLTPVLGFSILLYLSLEYTSDGPLWKHLGWSGYNNCKDTWWATLLYVQNYACPDNTCLGFSWYLAVDMQLYLLSPICLYALWRWGKKAVIGTVVGILLSWACLFTTIMINDYSMFYKRFMTLSASMKYIYSPTHLRISPWLVGLLFGYFIHVTKNKRIPLPKYMVVFGWILSLGLISVCIFSLLPKSQMTAAPLSTLEEALFISLSRIAWPLSLSWIVYACIEGYGGPINSFLSSPLWLPLSRLSYCMYVFHFFIININAGRVRTNTNFSSYDLMLHFWPDYGFTILLSVFMYLFLEAPLAGVENMLVSRRTESRHISGSEPSASEPLVVADEEE